MESVRPTRFISRALSLFPADVLRRRALAKKDRQIGLALEKREKRKVWKERERVRQKVEKKRELFSLLALSFFPLPDEPFHNFRASKSMHRRILCSSGTWRYKFLSSKWWKGTLGSSSTTTIPKIRWRRRRTGRRAERRKRERDPTFRPAELASARTSACV